MSTEPMNLAQLAPDVLQLLCEYLQGLHIGSLWLSGDRLLNIKLAKSGVTRFEHIFESYRPIIWPKLISNFERLQTLSLTCCHEIPLTGVNLYDMPPSITDLFFDFWNSDLVWLGIDDKERIRTLPKTEWTTSFRMFPIYERLPRLKSFVIRGQFLTQELIKYLPHNGVLESLDLPPFAQPVSHTFLMKHCPKSVTSLKIAELRVERDTVRPWLWPELKTFQARITCAPEELSGLPTTLTDLQTGSVTSFDDNSLGNNLLELLSERQLTRLAMDQGGLDSTWTLPSQLQHVQLYAGWTPSKLTLQHLPPNLQTMSFFSCPWVPPAERDEHHPLRQLPKTLTALGVAKDVGSTLPPSFFSMFPHLKELVISADSSCDGLFWDLPQSSLTSMVVHSLDPKVDFPHLPPSLINLRVNILAFGETAPDDWARLSRLQELRLGYYDTATGELNAAQTQTLPRSLTCLCIVGALVGDDCAQALPPGLKELEIEEVYQTTATERPSPHTDAFFEHLPRSLTSLRDNQAATITDRAISFLPRHLEYLDLNVKEDSHISDAAIKLLPRGLTYLDLGLVSTYTHLSVADLPRPLTIAQLAGSIALSPETNKHFPPHLSLLRLRNCRSLPTAHPEELAGLPLGVSLRCATRSNKCATLNSLSIDITEIEKFVDEVFLHSTPAS